MDGGIYVILKNVRYFKKKKSKVYVLQIEAFDYLNQFNSAGNV